MKKKVLSLVLAVLMLTSLALTGCQQKETPAAADQVAVALFEMILKNNAAPAVELFGYTDEAEARSDMGLDGSLYEGLADEVVSQFTSQGITASAEDVQAFIDAFISMFSQVEMTAKVKESDEKAGTAVVTCTISTFDSDALATAMTDAMTQVMSDPNALAGSDEDAMFSLILNAMSSAIAGLEPTGDTTDFDVDFELSTLDINGKEHSAWLPVDAEAFGKAISTSALGM